MNSTPPMRAARPPLSLLTTKASACSDALSTPDTLVGGSTPPTSTGWLSPASDAPFSKEHPSPHLTPALSSTTSIPSVSPDPFAALPSMPASLLLDDAYLNLSAASAPSFTPFLSPAVPFLSAASAPQPGCNGMLDFLFAPNAAPIGIPNAALPINNSVAPGLTERTAPPAAFTVPQAGAGGSLPQTGQPLGEWIRSWQAPLTTASSLGAGTFPQINSSFPGTTVNPSLKPFDLVDSPRLDLEDAEPASLKGEECAQPPATPGGEACTPSSPDGPSEPSASPSSAPVDLRRRPTEPKRLFSGTGSGSAPRPAVRKRDRDARFPCPKCGKVFTRNYNRLAHETVHEPDHPRPFICPAASCKKAFARKYDARRHYRLHVIRDNAPPELVERIVDSRRAPKP